MAGYAAVRDAAPRFLNPGRNWSGKCEAAAFNLANVLTPGPVRSFPDATSARKASKIEGPGLGPGGNWVWMSGVWGTENGRRVDWGHVAYHVGAGLLFMASSSVTDRIPGMTALGFIDGLAYLRRFSGQKLEGWSYDHGGTIIPGDGPIVVPAPHVHLIDTISKEILLMADFGIQAIEQREDVGGPDYQRIAIYGPGLYRVIEPPERDTYNALRSVTAKASREAGGTFLLPENATAVNAIGWDAIARVFNPDYGK